MAIDVAPFPMQTFFIPLPEESMFDTMFKIIQSKVAKPPIESMFSVSVSVDNTVIWYDHWEDGYEMDLVSPNSTTTEVWGDGDASNGCAPGKACTDELDVLKAGDSIVVQVRMGGASDSRSAFASWRKAQSERYACTNSHCLPVYYLCFFRTRSRSHATLPSSITTVETSCWLPFLWRSLEEPILKGLAA